MKSTAKHSAITITFLHRYILYRMQYLSPNATSRGQLWWLHTVHRSTPRNRADRYTNWATSMDQFQINNVHLEVIISTMAIEVLFHYFQINGRNSSFSLIDGDIESLYHRPFVAVYSIGIHFFSWDRDHSTKSRMHCYSHHMTVHDDDQDSDSPDLYLYIPMLMMLYLRTGQTPLGW